MPSERIQRRIDSLLDEADEAVSVQDWSRVAGAARAVLAIDRANEDAAAFLAMASANEVGSTTTVDAPEVAASEVMRAGPSAPATPESFAGGRYQVSRFLGEGGKKRVFLAHDTLLDRDVAFALIKTEGLDAVGRERVLREAQAMGRLTHPNVVAIFDIGEHDGAPYVVTELMSGGDVESELDAVGGPLPLARTLAIAKDVCRGLAFAHARQVVHRDLKPGNVWLTGDGTAKIGDFGLAVSLDRARLTQHGMMVGTYHYMPPEQALGADVTPQADLYSLGAMLYELVTGRAPFLGDTATAVISQHIHTAPVAPSWHSEHCPPDLEALILRLLAKAPADRPASAEEALAALEAVDPDGASARHSGSSANPLDRLARGVFVGRERELDQLRQRFDDALDGRGGLVMLVGEPGIGKTRTAQELETYARMRGANVLWGRAREAAGAPPYWPWIQVGRAFGASVDEQTLHALLRPESAELLRLFPELRTVAPELPDPPSLGDEGAQFRLFDAMASFFARAAEGAPIAIVLDDLHWADRPSLLMLQHLAGELVRSRVIIIGTYRDTELSRQAPLSEALAQLNREPGFTRLVLRGLSADEVASYVRGVGGVDPARDVLARIFEETEGNPFFLQEVVNLMAQEGTLEQDSVSDIAIPDGVREALGRRLDRLSADANDLLAVAAVVGREFTYDTLTLLGERSDDEMLRLVEEGLDARVIEELPEPGRYRFTHALMQETLLDELSTTRRVRMHGLVGEALERRWGDRAQQYASRLASHFAESATLSAQHAKKALHYAERAAQLAELQVAWDEAAHWYEIALSDEDLDPRVRFPLLMGLGRSRWLQFDQRSAWRALMQARSLAQTLGDADRLAKATLEAVRIAAPADRRLAMVEEAIDARPKDSGLEFDLHLHLLSLAAFNGWTEHLERARARLSILEDSDDVSESLITEWRVIEFMLRAARGDYEEARRSVPALLERLPLEGGRTLWPHYAVYSYAWEGRLRETDDGFRASLPVHRRAGFTVQVGNSLIALAANSILWGDFDDAKRFLSEVPGPNIWVDALLVRLLELHGDMASAQQQLPSLSDAGGFSVHVAMVHALKARMSYELDDEPRATAEIEACVEQLRRTKGAILEIRREMAIAELDTAIAITPIDIASELLDELVALGFKRSDPYLARNYDLTRGLLALRLDRLEEAERHFRTGAEWTQRERCPVELGRCLMGLAAIAERRDDHATTMEHLDAASSLFSKHGAVLYLDQVIAKKQILKA